jgi:hypothetical protein
MLTVYKYGFEMPKPPEPPSTSPLTYLLVAAAAWWAWKSGWARKLIGRTAV